MAAVKRSRGKTWTEEETKVLIDLWGEESIHIALDNAKTSRASSQVYKTLLVSWTVSIYCKFVSSVKLFYSSIKFQLQVNCMQLLAIFSKSQEIQSNKTVLIWLVNQCKLS